jgi:SSS family solute:Na+ symporter
VVPYYRKKNIISVYGYLEEKIGAWARIYASLSFVLFMIGRTAVILYLSSLLLSSFISIDIRMLIICIGIVTIVYTLMGGMEAVIWTDVMQSVIMIGGIIFIAYLLTKEVFSEPDFLIQNALDANKFSLGESTLSLSSRTIWVMIIYGVTENVRNLIADQNYTQKYCSVPDEKKAKRSVWIAMLIYLPLTALFLYIGTALFAFYSGSQNILGEAITKGDQVFPHFIATQLPAGVKGLIIAAILAASMSTVDSALNCSATVLFIDYYKKYIRPSASEKNSVNFLRLTTVVWGVAGIGFALLLINAESALDIWWIIAGVFGGGILGLFLLSIFNIKISQTQGIISVIFSILIIIWGSFFRNLPDNYAWLECTVDPIIIGAMSTTGLVLLALFFVFVNKKILKKTS